MLLNFHPEGLDRFAKSAHVTGLVAFDTTGGTTPELESN